MNTNPNTTPMILLSNITNLVSIKLDHNNYMLWKFQITSTLKAYKLLDVVDGSYPCPEMCTRDSNGVVTTIRVHSMGHQRSSLDLYDKCNSVSFSLGTCLWSKICKRSMGYYRKTIHIFFKIQCSWSQTRSQKHQEEQ
jgi:hypothetical protein